MICQLLDLMLLMGVALLAYSPEKCKSGVGSRAGLQKRKEVIHIHMWAGIGRPESVEIGIHALIFLAKSLLISCLSKAGIHLLIPQFFSIFLDHT